MNPGTITQRGVGAVLLECLEGYLLTCSEAHLEEAALVEAIILRERLRNAAPFCPAREGTVRRLAEVLGFGKWAGRCAAVNPEDGSRATARVAAGEEDAAEETELGAGCMMVMVLKHWAAEKLQVRGEGPGYAYDPITEQPAEGRIACGGGKRGEMEWEALLCHGAMFAAFAKDSLNSDAMAAPVCVRCRRLACGAGHVCGDCGEALQHALISGSFRALVNRLRALNIDMRFTFARSDLVPEPLRAESGGQARVMMREARFPGRREL